MAENTMLGGKVRALRRRENMTQGQLADRLGISPSYLNLIENNRRPLTAPMLIKLAQLFELDLSTFGTSGDVSIVSDLREAFGDPLFDNHNVTTSDLKELAGSSPALAKAVIALYRAYRDTRESAETLSERLEGGEGVAGMEPTRLPTEEVNDLIQRHMNHFPTLEDAADEVRARSRLESDDVYRSLVRYLDQEHGVDVRLLHVADERKAMRRYDREARRLSLSELLPPRSRRFQLAHQIGLLSASDTIDRLLESESGLSNPESRALARVALANYFAAALLMPYVPFYEAARAERYDIELLAHRFGTSFEQVCHRLTTLRRPSAEGVPFHFLRIDIAGNISKRFSGSGIRFARFNGACPRWAVHTAFLTPGMIRVQLSRMTDGTRYFCVARTVRNDRGGYHAPHSMLSVSIGCEARFAKELVYSDGVDVESHEALVPVGVTCRLCEHHDCEQRVFPPMQHPLRIDENLRGVSFFGPTPKR
ncbi:helix-turn-helix domain-containing protein [Polyangium mundeleinium]|uniref:Short-chain fatty acyl-CoA regulator family protein n=1 Tax=Polyangium mundeleinium TaxID=2995306 RepID=A0ABT5EZG4_9BACT|nr:helix-turn-helix transcriptional regulator [Polyangium mundeleinium]MDC0746292.1 short-chain fatty acyl-CoA regulator family protein [Polyangium mundeleinium]